MSKQKLYYRDDKHEKLYRELLQNTSAMKEYYEFYYFGVSTVLATVFDWCDELDDQGLKTLSTNALRRAFQNYYDSAPRIAEMTDMLRR